jgi:DNA-directed RNA polymerase
VRGVGNTIGKLIRRDPLEIELSIKLGLILIDAFIDSKIVDYDYIHGMDGGYVLKPGENYGLDEEDKVNVGRYSFLGTVDRKPSKIYSIYQDFVTISGVNVHQSVIKGWTEEDAERFSPHVNKKWVRAINKLQSVPWRINTRVLDVLNSLPNDPVEDNEEREKRRKSKQVEKDFIKEKSNRLRDKAAFYQMIDTDYRGRLYYSETIMNFQGSDYARGVMEFAIGKPMTPAGNYWLAVHTACSRNQSYKVNEIPDWCEEDYASYLKREGLDTISVDKMTLDDRAAWTSHHIDEILERGENLDILHDAEKPLSYLACCIEWYDMNKAIEEGREHMSHLPIPIDGSNNGWQHLGAISKDTQTGELVGLIPVEIQKDFYVQTAKKLAEITDNEDLSQLLSDMPMKHIRKGISKRGSMTRAYSAGAKKIGENMWSDCRSEDFDTIYGITEDDCLKLAGFLVKAIKDVCPGPLETMEYLQRLAEFEIGKYSKTLDGKIADVEFRKLRRERKAIFQRKDDSDEWLEELNENSKQLEAFSTERTYGQGHLYLQWTTPSGFPVRSEAYMMTPLRIRAMLDKKQRTFVARVPTEIPNLQKHMTSVSPNFIHSMDASHMAEVICAWDGDFGAVHDSFSTHACDVEDLLAVTKQKFINMYNVPNFYNKIEEQLITDRTGFEVEQPYLGELNIQEIDDSDYFFA